MLEYVYAFIIMLLKLQTQESSRLVGNGLWVNETIKSIETANDSTVIAFIHHLQLDTISFVKADTINTDR